MFGKSPLDLYFYMYYGAFGTWFSWQNTLTRAAPLILTALCTALPAQLGMVIIGGEGALLIGALSATAVALALQWAPPLIVQLAMVCGGVLGGGIWITLSGALRQYRGVNETISSLLLAYIALAILNHLVEGLMRDPASLNKPSTREIGAPNMIGSIPGTDRKSTRLNSSHSQISYAVFCLKKKTTHMRARSERYRRNAADQNVSAVTDTL